VFAALVLALAGCGEEEDSPMMSEPGELRCGSPIDLSGPGGLRLAGRFPESAPAGQPAVDGVVEVTSREAVRGVAAAAADVFLVRDGRVVATPLAQDAVGVQWELAAGETRTMPGMASLVSCEPDGGPLPPGRYELYARVVLTPDDGRPQTAFGGPWRLRLR
jgi:hypothetical protein